MLNIESLIQPILRKEHWQIFDLNMSIQGFDVFSKALEQTNKNPQVYVHVCKHSNLLKDKVLRIGKAESGVMQRWIKAGDGHKSTFIWSLGEESRYSKPRAIKTPLYMLFFAGLLNLDTKLYVLNCEDKMTARSSETTLINFFHPLWESFKNAHELNPDYPILSGQKRCEESSVMIADPGAAIRLLNTQRSGSSLKRKLPDILDFDSVKTTLFHEDGLM